MPTPLGHMIVGASVGLAFSPKKEAPSLLAWTALGAAIAVLPDLDLIPVAFGAQWGKVHRTITHSLVVAGILSAAFMCAWRIRGGLLVFFALSAHLLMDLFCEDPLPPLGICLFWPVSDAFIYPDTFIFLSLFTPKKTVIPLMDFIFVMTWELTMAALLSTLILLVFGNGKHRVAARSFLQFTRELRSAKTIRKKTKKHHAK